MAGARFGRLIMALVAFFVIASLLVALLPSPRV